MTVTLEYGICLSNTIYSKKRLSVQSIKQLLKFRLVTLINFYFVTNPIGLNTLKGVIAVEWSKSAVVCISCVSISR